MSTQTLNHNVHDHDHHADEMDSVTISGFWLYLMTDCISFATLFAMYAVYSDAVANAPSAKDLFELGFVAVETAILLISSLTFGFATLSQQRKDKSQAMLWLAVTLVLGIAFLAMELYEFNHFIAEGAGPSASAFLSAFFLLVGTHGAHVLCGCVWLVVMMVQLSARGFDRDVNRRLKCLSIFWHFLDLIWIGVFTSVYLLGAMQ